MPTPTPAPPAPKRDGAERKKIPVLVLYDSAPSVHVSLTASNAVWSVVGMRLRESAGLEVEGEGKRVGRGEASRRAKAQEGGQHVVWLQVLPNGIDNDSAGVRRPRPEDLHIQYVIFEPGTARVKEHGNVYIRPTRVLSGVGLGCYPPGTVLDYELVEGAVETADRVIEAFDLPRLPACR